MKHFQYLIVEQALFSDALGPYTAFGIRGETVTATGVVESVLISDVSIDATFVAALAKRCTDAQLQLCHLVDVVFDAVIERSFF